MRILFIANGNGLSDKLGGSITRTINLAKNIEQRGHEIHFLTTIGGFKACKRAGLKADFCILPASLWNKSESGLSDRVLAYVISTIGSLPTVSVLSEADACFTDSDFFCDVIPAMLYRRRFKLTRWVASTYHFIPSPTQRSGGFKLLNLISYIGQQFSLKIIKNKADLIATETKFVGSELEENIRISHTKILVIQSGINPQIIDSVGWDGNKKYDACYLGGLRRTKGIFDLIKAWESVCKQFKTAKLAIAGGNSTVSIEEVRHEIKKRGLESNIDILGFISEKEKYQLFKSSRLYVLPSYEEGIPITFYEAMYCGLPIITYFLPPYREIAEYITAVPIGEDVKLSEAVLRFLENKDLSKNFSEKGRKFAKMHTWDKISDYMINELEMSRNVKTL
jgi:glycosyltransferase involved in cell wall biosynthesis